MMLTDNLISSRQCQRGMIMCSKMIQVWFSILLLLCFSTLSSFSQDFETCNSIVKFLDESASNNLYDRLVKFKKAIEQLEKINQSFQDRCRDDLTFRAIRECAAIHFKHGKDAFTFGTEGRKNFSAQSAKYYEKALTWFSDLGPSRQNSLIKVSQSELNDDVKKKWLESVIGSTLSSLGDALDGARDHKGLIKAYEEFYQKSEDAEYMFSLRAVKEWKRWLQNQSNFNFDQTNPGVFKKDIEKCGDARDHWNNFRLFLDDYLKTPTGKKVADLKERHEKIKQWLDAAKC